jgi:hypothetical protein
VRRRPVATPGCSRTRMADLKIGHYTGKRESKFGDWREYEGEWVVVAWEFGGGCDGSGCGSSDDCGGAGAQKPG